MQGLKITFATDPYGDLCQDQVEALQKQRINELLPILIENNLWFRFELNLIRESERDSPYVKLVITTKCFRSHDADEVKGKFEKMTGVSVRQYICCEVPGCYDVVAGDSLKYPVTDIRRNEDADNIHAIHLICMDHLDSKSLRLLETLETIEERSGDCWRCIHVWRFWNRWMAQRVWQKWDRGDFRVGESWPYLVSTRWIVARTREQAIEAARSQKEA